MASLLASAPETFTGTSGNTPNTANTVAALNEGSGGGYTIQSGQGRLRTGTTAFNRLSVRAVIAARQNAEIVFDYVIPADNSQYPQIVLRHSTTAIDLNTCYIVTLERTGVLIGRFSNYSSTDINNSVTYSGRTVGQIIRVRVAIFGNTIKMRSWPAANAENTGAWDVTVTDATISAAGYFGITTSSASSGSKDFFIDNLDVLDTETATQKKITSAGSVTPGGALLKNVPKTFVGSIAASGALAIRRVVVRTFTGSLGPTGALNGKQGAKNFTGSIAPTGAHRKVGRKVFAGSVAPAATIKRNPRKRFLATIAATGNYAATNVGRVFGEPGLVVVSIRKAAQVRARIRKG